MLRKSRIQQDGTVSQSSLLDNSESNAIEYSVTEINVRRLLRKCEDMKDGKTKEWRFEKYVEALTSLLLSFTSALDAVKRNDVVTSRLTDYKLRVEKLQKLAHPETFPETPRELLLENRSTLRQESVSRDQVASKHTLERIPSVSSSERSTQGENVGFAAGQTEPVKPVSSPAISNISTPSNRDITAIVATEMRRQEEITEEMLLLTQALKDNMTTANKLVKRDFKVIDTATSLADRNVVRLSKEADKLAEQNQKNTSWWVLLALLSLFGIFVMMVLFMRMFPKPRAYRGH